MVSIYNDHISLFFTGGQHAGENLVDLLAKREADLGPPIQMCDALTRNLPKDFEILVANCTSHGRRRFAEAYDNFPDECAYCTETVGESLQKLRRRPKTSAFCHKKA
jgi:hypothetical protein